MKIRLYGCLRIAVGWVLFHVRDVDDGRFRRSVCEGLGLCYFLQSLAVLRAQFTDDRNWWVMRASKYSCNISFRISHHVFTSYSLVPTRINWIAIMFLTTIGTSYVRFRFGKGGDMIKIYELPSLSSRMNR